MTRNTIATSVRVFVRNEHGGLYASSPNLPGLSVYGRNEEQIRDRVEKAIVLLYKHNHQIDVTVIFAVDPITMAPRPLGVSTDVVLAQAA